MSRGRHRTPRTSRLPRGIHSLLAFVVMIAVAATFTGFPSPDAVAATRGHRYHPRNDGGAETHHRNPHRVAATCTLAVPARPLTAAGLASPYLLRSGDSDCTEGSPDTSAFVEATILDPATGALFAYRPLVVDAGSAPALPPHVPALPPNAVVALWFGFQGDTLQLTGPGARPCTNGVGRSLFGQFAYCNARPFFRAARRSVHPPALGTALDGLPCPSIRDFSVVDQDQSDNVSTEYTRLPGGVAQSTVASREMPGATPLRNGSDNGLLNRAIQPALGCATWTVPDLTDPDPGAPGVPTLALNELQAAAFQGAPVALVPSTDPMTQTQAKTVLYRLGVGQSPAGIRPQTAAYCQNMMAVGLPRIQEDRPFTQDAPSPQAGVGLYDFLLARFMSTADTLGCG